MIDPLILAEVARGFDRIEDLDEVLAPQYFTREPLPRPPRSSPVVHSCPIVVELAAGRLIQP